MRASPRGVLQTGLLILFLLLVGCTGSPGPARTSSTGTAARPIVTSASDSSTRTEQASPSCTSQQRVPPEGEFTDVKGWIAYRCGSDLIAVDPARPHHPLSLGPAHLTSLFGSDEADPIGWSRDGTRLLLLAERADGGGRDLFVLDADGFWTPLKGAGWGSFSPDGIKVVYGSGDAGPFVIHADGGGGRRSLTPPPTGIRPGYLRESAAWSPSGSRIAFIDFRYRPRPYGISVVNPDGTGLRELVHLGGWGEAGSIAWSPDGSRIAFSLIIGGHDPRGQIRVVDADGSGLRRITHEGDNRWPAWSPDGSRIAFVRGGRLFTMAPDGSDVQRVKGVEPDGAIAWNPIG